jgi:hypothetical protein
MRFISIDDPGVLGPSPSLERRDLKATAPVLTDCWMFAVGVTRVADETYPFPELGIRSLSLMTVP